MDFYWGTLVTWQIWVYLPQKACFSCCFYLKHWNKQTTGYTIPNRITFNCVITIKCKSSGQFLYKKQIHKLSGEFVADAKWKWIGLVSMTSIWNTNVLRVFYWRPKIIPYLKGKPHINMFMYLSLCYQRERMSIFSTKKILLQVSHNYFSAFRKYSIISSFSSIFPQQGKKMRSSFFHTKKSYLLLQQNITNSKKSTNKANNSWLLDR